MSISQVASKLHAHKQQDLPQHQDAYRPKALGTGGQASQELVNWYSQAYAYYQQVASGQVEMPDEASWAEFMDQLNWAVQQIYGNNPQAGGWGDNGFGQGTPTADKPYEDPFGGQEGPNGNIVYTGEKAEIGFLGDNRTYDIFSYDVTLNIYPTSAKITVSKVMDNSVEPPAEVWKVIVEDKALGGKATYILHNVNDLEKLKIKSPKPENIEVQFEDERIELEEFNAAENLPTEHDPDTVMPPTEIGDHSYRYDVVPGKVGNFWFEPGTDTTHTIWGDTNINLLPSDRVDVYEGKVGGAMGSQNGWFTLVITHADGSKDTVYVKDSYKHNINGNPGQIHWHSDPEGGNPGESLAPNTDSGGGGVIDEVDGETDDLVIQRSTHSETIQFMHVDADALAALGDGGNDGNGANPPAPTGEGMDIPDAFDDVFTVNNQADATPPHNPLDDIPPVIRGLESAMGLETGTIPEHLWQYFENATLPPSDELIGVLAYYDPQLKAAIDNLKEYPNHSTPDVAWTQVRDRLATLLGKVWPGATGENLWNLENEEARQTLYLDGSPYTMSTRMFQNGGAEGENFWSISLKVSDAEGPQDPQAANDEIKEEVGEITYGEMLEVAQGLADLPYVDLTAEQIVAMAYNDFDIDLSNAVFPPNQNIWKFLGELDPHLVQKWSQVNQAYMDVWDKGEGDATMIHGKVGDFVQYSATLLAGLYPDQDIEYAAWDGYQGGGGINELHLLKVNGEWVNILQGTYIGNPNSMDLYNAADWTEVMGWETGLGE